MFRSFHELDSGIEDSLVGFFVCLRARWNALASIKSKTCKWSQVENISTAYPYNFQDDTECGYSSVCIYPAQTCTCFWT